LFRQNKTSSIVFYDILTQVGNVLGFLNFVFSINRFYLEADDMPNSSNGIIDVFIG